MTRYDTDNDQQAMHVGPRAPQAPTEGMPWYDTGADVLKVYVAGAWVTISSSLSFSVAFRLEYPVSGDAIVFGALPVAATITKVKHQTASGTCSFNIEKRSTPQTAGTDIFTADKSATTSHTSETTINSAGVTAEDYLALTISGTPTATVIVGQIIGTIP